MEMGMKMRRMDSLMGLLVLVVLPSMGMVRIGVGD
jgi:hypothetical protein